LAPHDPHHLSGSFGGLCAGGHVSRHPLSVCHFAQELNRGARMPVPIVTRSIRCQSRQRVPLRPMRRTIMDLEGAAEHEPWLAAMPTYASWSTDANHRELSLQEHFIHAYVWARPKEHACACVHVLFLY
jgi:hypothetical protein